MTRQRSRNAAGVSRFQRSARWAATLAATFGASTLSIMLATHSVRAGDQPSPASNHGYQFRLSDLEAAAEATPATVELANPGEKRQSTTPGSNSKTAPARKQTAKPVVKPTVSHAALPTDDHEVTNSTPTVAAIFAALTGAGRTKVASEHMAKHDEAKYIEVIPGTAKRGATQQPQTDQIASKQIESKRSESSSSAKAATSARLSDSVRVNPKRSDMHRAAEIAESKADAPVSNAAPSNLPSSPESKPFQTVKKRIFKSKKQEAAEANSRDGVDSSTSPDKQNAIAAKQPDDELIAEFCATEHAVSEPFGADILAASNQPGNERSKRSSEAVAGKNGGSDNEACDESCLKPLQSLATDLLRLESQPNETSELGGSDSAAETSDETVAGIEAGDELGSGAGGSPGTLRLHSASRADMQREADRALDVSKRVLNAIGFRPASSGRTAAPSRSK